MSYAALPWLLDEYELLPCGGALGRGCGPLVLTRGDRPTAGDLAGATVAVPGDRTTAYLLFRLWARNGRRRAIEVVPFHEIMPGVAAGRYDAGLVIHEARFTYPRYGLTALVDLGEWWEGETGLPIPLGAILARRGAVDPAAATDWIRDVGAACLGQPGGEPRLRAANTPRRWSPTWSTSTSGSTSTSSPWTWATRATPRRTPCSAGRRRPDSTPPLPALKS